MSAAHEKLVYRVRQTGGKRGLPLNELAKMRQPFTLNDSG
jgi:hypothetical protein